MSTRILILASSIVACESANTGIAGTYVTRDSANVRIVDSTSPAWSDGVQLDSIPLLRIGREEDGPYQFSLITQGLMLDGGRIAIAEGRAREIRVFDSAGTHLATSGRAGSGPGEFRGIAGLFRYHGDSLAIYDQQLRRTTIMPLSAGTPRTIANDDNQNLLAFGVDQRGHVFLYNPGSGYRPDLPPGLQWDTTDIVVMSPADGGSRTVARLASREQFIEPDGNTRVRTPAHGSIQAVDDDGFYWATTDRYEIRSYDGDGVLQRILRRPVQPTMVEPDMVDAWVESNLERVRRFEGESAVPRYRRRFDEMEYGEQVPLFGTAFVDADRRLWVSESLWPRVQGAPGRWSVFSPDGVLLGELDVPDGVRVLDSRGDFVLAVWPDELDVPHVQIHRLLR